MINKKLSIFIFLIICMFAISSVAASDINEINEVQTSESATVDDIGLNDEQSDELKNTASDSEDSDLDENQNDDLKNTLSEGEEQPTGNYIDLKQDIETAVNELNLSRNYAFNETTDNDYLLE
ncbi:hypothetical protein [Methanobrevibacter sp.]